MAKDNPATDPDASAEERLAALTRQQHASQKQAVAEAQAEATAQVETRDAFIESRKKRK